MTQDNKIQHQPEYNALNKFDAESNVEPARRIARRIAMKYDCGRNNPLVDDIAHAIEDALSLGEKRATHMPELQKMRAAIKRIDAINDNPACYNSEINDLCEPILRPHLPL